MDDVIGIAVSLGGDVGPFQPYAEVEEEEPQEVSSQCYNVSGGVEVKLVLKRDSPSVGDPSATLVLEEEANESLPTHVYSKVGKIPPRTYSREVLAGLSGARLLMKLS